MAGSPRRASCANSSRAATSGRRGEVEQFVDNFDDEVTGDMRREFAISVHPVQVGSKLWLIDELARHCNLSGSSLVILGAWYGILPLILNWRLADPPVRWRASTATRASARWAGE